MSFVDILIKNNIVQKEQTANTLLLFFVILIFGATLVLAYVYFWKADAVEIPYREMTTEQKRDVPWRERSYIEERLRNN